MYLVILLMGLLTAGCYELSPKDEDLRTVPVTNNPHVHPGYERPSSLPQMQY